MIPLEREGIPHAKDRCGESEGRLRQDDHGLVSGGRHGAAWTALCLAVGMAQRGRRTLLIGGDSQGNASMTMLDGAAIDPPTLGNIRAKLAAAERVGPEYALEAIRPTRDRGSTCCRWTRSLRTCRSSWRTAWGREHRLRNALGALGDRYDVAIVDCPPHSSLVVVTLEAIRKRAIVSAIAGDVLERNLLRLRIEREA
jgi:chromosome partitioning protein